MDWITFSSNLIDSIAWPLAIVIVVFWLKEHIKELLPFVRKVRYGNVEVDFAEITERKTDEVLEEKKKVWSISVDEMLERQNIAETKIKTLKDEISGLVSDAVQETRQVEKETKTEMVRETILAIVSGGLSVDIVYDSFVEYLTVKKGYPRSLVIDQLDEMHAEGIIRSSTGPFLLSESTITLPS